MEKILVNIFKEALEIESVNLDDYLDVYDNWDSLTRLSLIALIDEHFEIQFSDKEFNEFKTGKDIYKALLKKNTN
tara:strand:- start:33 stop:257 length:225 start_codon:yes stop_codon:yes gene_type:complete